MSPCGFCHHCRRRHTDEEHPRDNNTRHCDLACPPDTYKDEALWQHQTTTLLGRKHIDIPSKSDLERHRRIRGMAALQTSTVTTTNGSNHAVLSTDPSDPRRRVLVRILLQGGLSIVADNAFRIIPRGVMPSNETRAHTAVFERRKRSWMEAYGIKALRTSDDYYDLCLRRFHRYERESPSNARVQVQQPARSIWLQFGCQVCVPNREFRTVCNLPKHDSAWRSIALVLAAPVAQLVRRTNAQSSKEPLLLNIILFNRVTDPATQPSAQIERDLHRIGDFYVARVERCALRDLCKALSAHDPITGYAQGINLLGAKVLCMLGGDARCAFFTLVYVCTFGYVASFNRVGKSFSDTPLMHDVLLIEELLSRHPKLLPDGRPSDLLHISKHVGLDRNLYATVPLLMLLVQDGCGYSLSAVESDTIWDYMIESAHHFVVLCCIVALVSRDADALMRMTDPGEALALLLRGEGEAESLKGESGGGGGCGGGRGLRFASVARVMRRVEEQRLEHLERHRMAIARERIRIVHQVEAFRRKEEEAGS